MARLILYLLESGVVLACFYLLYALVMRHETFFTINRFFLLGILIVSALFPLLSVDVVSANLIGVDRPIEEISKFRMSYYDAVAAWEYEGHKATVVTGRSTINTLTPAIDWITIALTTLIVVYILGILFCFSRIAWTLRWIRNMITRYSFVEMDGVKVVRIPEPVAPFSFFHYVFVHEGSFITPDFDQILKHEQIHIREKHSLDLIFVQLVAAFFWFNPVVWRLIKSLKTTHEYIADEKIINSGYSLVAYQTLLLRQLISNHSSGLVHNFNLSFIKKRITMMKNKKSGWSGKVKTALAIAITLITGAVIVQCNSKIDEQVALQAKADDNGGVTLPVLPETGFKTNWDLTHAMHFTIAGNKLTINGSPYEVEDIVPMIEKGDFPIDKVFVLFNIDKAQSMKFVREVQTELRKAERRKILYMGKTASGENVETPITLPPTPENALRNGDKPEPLMSDVEAKGQTGILKIDLGENAGVANQKKVYDFVKSYLEQQSSDYVVSARFDDHDTYQDYLVNLVYIKEGFNQLYQERSQQMFGKNFYETDKAEYQAVRAGIPTSISIAER